jgi:hypothetical protein
MTAEAAWSGHHRASDLAGQMADGVFRSDSQADSASSILVTRSTTKRLVTGVITLPLAGHQDASCRPRARYVPDGPPVVCLASDP